MKFSHKVVCIKDFKDTSLEKELTYGKVYMVNDLYKDDPGHYYVLVNDLNTLEGYHRKWFIGIENWRDRQINKIL